MAGVNISRKSADNKMLFSGYGLFTSHFQNYTALQEGAVVSLTVKSVADENKRNLERGVPPCK